MYEYGSILYASFSAVVGFYSTIIDTSMISFLDTGPIEIPINNETHQLSAFISNGYTDLRE